MLYFFFFNDTATTEIYTLSLHDALPISGRGLGRGRAPPRPEADPAAGVGAGGPAAGRARPPPLPMAAGGRLRDRKSTRLNSSHANISYAVFCLKKKKKHNIKSIHHLHIS